MQKMLTVNYNYEVFSDLEKALKKQDLHSFLEHTLIENKKFKSIETKILDESGRQFVIREQVKVDDTIEIEVTIDNYLDLLGRAGFYLYFQNSEKKDLINYQCVQELQGVFEKGGEPELSNQKEQMKRIWADTITQTIRWDRSRFKKIHPKIFRFLSREKVVIP